MKIIVFMLIFSLFIVNSSQCGVSLIYEEGGDYHGSSGKYVSKIKNFIVNVPKRQKYEDYSMYQKNLKEHKNKVNEFTSKNLYIESCIDNIDFDWSNSMLSFSASFDFNIQRINDDRRSNSVIILRQSTKSKALEVMKFSNDIKLILYGHITDDGVFLIEREEVSYRGNMI